MTALDSGELKVYELTGAELISNIAGLLENSMGGTSGARESSSHQSLYSS